MAKVFIGGSRQLTELEAAVCDRLDRIVAKGLPVLVGDAGGAHEAVQRYFRGRGYANVTVFSSDARPRHNVGGWPVRVTQPGRARTGLEFHASKDRAMAGEATVGLMLWDGRSRGTLLNVLRLSWPGSRRGPRAASGPPRRRRAWAKGPPTWRACVSSRSEPRRSRA